MHELLLPRALRALRAWNFPRKLGVLERVFGGALANGGIAWVRTSRGLLWKLDLGMVGHRWIVYGDYEGPCQMAWIRSWLAPGGVVVDSGASVGEMAQYFAEIPGVSVLACEPVPSSFEWLCECLEQNRELRIEALQLALGEAPGEVEMQLAGPRSTFALEWYRGQSNARQAVRVERLDSILAQRGVERIRLWKLDVEGSEVSALRGASQYLRRRAIEAILVEVAPSLFAPIRAQLQEFGYRLHRILPRARLVPTERQVRFGNLVALPGDVRPPPQPCETL
jgi:FkbM family methyltransferase